VRLKIRTPLARAFRRPADLAAMDWELDSLAAPSDALAHSANRLAGSAIGPIIR
jgi:hypothetical protein